MNNTIKLVQMGNRDCMSVDAGAASEPCERVPDTRAPTNARIVGKQSNHGDYCLPVDLAHLGNPPLWLAVAWWGGLRGTAFSRDDVSQVFRISARRAGDVMSYIMNHKKDTVQCLRSLTKSGNGVRVLHLRITNIREVSGTAPKPSPTTDCAKAKAKPDGDNLRKNRAWFLTSALHSPQK
ncbi:CaiF/GrlA family transcriptional regulator [Serratia marcescens]|nr:CaiF/GrlA family transcriptional regulator [Serratia marcescens]MBH3063780.1 CaiF/GrlA family transcriptional regulator [Serratia marcescens]